MQKKLGRTHTIYGLKSVSHTWLGRPKILWKQEIMIQNGLARQAGPFLTACHALHLEVLAVAGLQNHGSGEVEH